MVNKLANACDLPKEFLHYFISKCIIQCEENKKVRLNNIVNFLMNFILKDKNQQNRLIRLLCAFIKSMIKNKILNPAEMFIEVYME